MTNTVNTGLSLKLAHSFIRLCVLNLALYLLLVPANLQARNNSVIRIDFGDHKTFHNPGIEQKEQRSLPAFMLLKPFAGIQPPHKITPKKIRLSLGAFSAIFQGLVDHCRVPYHAGEHRLHHGNPYLENVLLGPEPRLMGFTTKKRGNGYIYKFANRAMCGVGALYLPACGDFMASNFYNTLSIGYRF